MNDNTTPPTAFAKVRTGSTFLQAFIVWGAAVAVGLGACAIDYPVETVVPRQTTPIVLQDPIDILFVVDNSGSMLEEQATLYRSVYDDRCPITDVSNVPFIYRSPDRATFDELREVCGLSQLMAATGSDFHIGVIATDVGNWDERVSAAQDIDNTHEQLPMRGCLQGKGLITVEDDIAVEFRDAVIGLGTAGSPIERGLDAMELFLDPASRRAPGCDNDLDGFLRPSGRLVVVFVTDEDDCSHRDGASGFPDELDGEPVEGGDWPELFRANPSNCYDRVGELAPIVGYRDALQALIADGRTTDVVVAAVAGARDDGLGFVAGGCVATSDDIVSGNCSEARGTSSSCSPEQNCCTADAGRRYVELALAVNADSLLGSICAADFLDPLLPLFTVAELGGEEVF